MSRTSKKTILPHRVYSAGIYARLSVEGEERKNESINNQIEIAKNYIKEHTDLILYQCYSDLGKTGTNFERKGFEMMMQDVRRKKIDCIIVKDLSRFGRNHIETGNYVEKIFPFLGVRFIAVTDKFDSVNSTGGNDMLNVDLKNLVNELYAKDIAVKVKSSKKIKKDQGSYTGGIPPYGYTAEWIDGKKCLMIEETTADIVRKIYQLALSGKNRKEIAAWLHQNQIHRPKDYHATGHVYRKDGELLQEWTGGTIKLLLTNPVYMGCLVQAGTWGKDHGPGKGHDIDPEPWSIKEHTHEAVISEEMFYQMAKIFEKSAKFCNKDGYSKTVPPKEDIFMNVLFCGECGARMRRVSSSKVLSKGKPVRHYGYCCPSSDRVDIKCGTKYISLNTLTELVKSALGLELSLSSICLKELAKRNEKEAEAAKKKRNSQLLKIQINLENVRRRSSEEYVRYRMGDLSKANFQKKKTEEGLRAADLQMQQVKCEQLLEQAEKTLKEKNQFLLGCLKFDKNSVMTGEMIQTLIDRIEIYPDKRVKIISAFTIKEVCGNGKDQDRIVPAPFQGG